MMLDEKMRDYETAQALKKQLEELNPTLTPAQFLGFRPWLDLIEQEKLTIDTHTIPGKKELE